MNAALSSGTRLLDPLLVAKLATMEMRARYIVEGALAGRHRSLRQGHALEFSGHRPFTPSDEWRRIDWKVFAKTDRWVVREQQEESNLRATLLMDASRSMDFSAGGRVSKLRYAAFLLAALGYLLVKGRESVGWGFFDRGLRTYVPARGGYAHLAHFLESLEKAAPGGETDVGASLEQAGQRLARRGLVIVVSDFLQATEKVVSAVRTLLSRKHEVVALQVLDPEEVRFSFAGDYLFEDLETGEVLRADAGDVRREYRRLMSERLSALEKAFHSLGVDHHRFETDHPLDQGLSHFLQRRMARA